MTKDTQRRLLTAGVVVVVAGLLVWSFWPGEPREDSGDGGALDLLTSGQKDKGKGPAPGASGGGGAATQPSTEPVGVVRPELSAQEAEQSFQGGMSLLQADKPVEARAALARALLSGELPADLEARARETLAELADTTIFSRRVFKDDPYTFIYKLEPGEALAKAERKLKLHVPWQLVLRVNGIADARTIQPTQRLKLIRGPFHAVVHKSAFAMDVFLQDTFVRRFNIGIGTAETPTPAGFFRVTLGGKLTNAPYTPPVSSGKPQVRILPDHPEYPLDKGGHWISLSGIPEKGTDITTDEGYGIHGTNDPASVGKAMSMGCIRLSDQDIGWLFAMLYEKWSTVEIRP